MQLVEQLEFTGQLMSLLPLGGEFGPFLVIVMVRQLLACVGVPAEGPKAIKVDFVTHGGGQRVHEDPSAQTFGGEVFSLPVSARKQEVISSVISPTHLTFLIYRNSNGPLI